MKSHFDAWNATSRKRGNLFPRASASLISAWQSLHAEPSPIPAESIVSMPLPPQPRRISSVPTIPPKATPAAVRTTVRCSSNTQVRRCVPSGKLNPDRVLGSARPGDVSDAFPEASWLRSNRQSPVQRAAAHYNAASIDARTSPGTVVNHRRTSTARRVPLASMAVPSSTTRSHLHARAARAWCRWWAQPSPARRTCKHLSARLPISSSGRTAIARGQIFWTTNKICGCIKCGR